MAARKPRQMQLIKQAPRSFGGGRLKSNPKTKRTLSTKEPLHLILKSSFATGARSFLSARNQSAIKNLVQRQAARSKIKIFHFVNVGNHLHLVLQLPDRKSFNAFVRSVAGLIARHVLRAQRGARKLVRTSADFETLASEKGVVDFGSLIDRFWDARPFSRIVSWGRDFAHLTKYMRKNVDQAKGLSRIFTDRAHHPTAPKTKIINKVADDD